MIPAIRVENLCKSFEGKTAVDHVTFSVPEGELFGLLGPNGAGKTTAINILATLLRPTAGIAEVAGIPVAGDRDALRRRIGVVFQEPALDSRLTGRENLDFHAMMYGLRRAERQQRLREVLELVDLQDRADHLVETYSGGMKRRLEIARGLIQSPQILFLDEPTLGLDAQTRRHIWDYIKQMNRVRKVTIVLTTHYMDEADYLCERVAIIDRGRIVAMDAPARLKSLLGGDVVDLLAGEGEERLEERLRREDWIKVVRRQERWLFLTMENGDRRIPRLLELARQSGVSVSAVNLHQPSLEDVFLHFTGRSMREEEGPADAGFRFVRHGRRG
jgi:ABC-2 type transport system ATP-binding protein